LTDQIKPTYTNLNDTLTAELLLIQATCICSHYWSFSKWENFWISALL